MPVSCCHPAAREAKAGDHLVENQQRAVLRRDRAQLCEKLTPLQQQAVVCRYGLDDDRGDTLAFGGKQRLERRFVIERQHARARGEGRGHACG